MVLSVKISYLLLFNKVCQIKCQKEWQLVMIVASHFALTLSYEVMNMNCEYNFMLKSTTEFRLVNSKAGISNHEKCISSKNCYLKNGGVAITWMSCCVKFLFKMTSKVLWAKEEGLHKPLCKEEESVYLTTTN